MRNSPEDQEDRREEAPAEPPADLLRRALSHVEDLLGRLEYPTVKQDDLPDLTDDDQDELSIFADEPADVAGAAVDPHLPPARLDEASAPAPSDLAPRIEEQARAMAEAVLDQARRDADLIRAEGRAEAEHLIAEAELEAERVLAAADVEARQRLAPGARPAGQAYLDSRSGTDGTAPADGAGALQDARAAAADRAEAREMLDSARFALAGVRSEVQALREALLFSVGSIESAERAIDALLQPRAGAALSPSHDGAPNAAESAVTR
jgi:hypothetical protein